MTTAASDVLPQVPLRPYRFRSLRVNETRKSGIDLSLLAATEVSLIA